MSPEQLGPLVELKGEPEILARLDTLHARPASRG